MFYEALSCKAQRRSIGIAESYDEGVTWRGLGSILSSKSQDFLRRPSVFTYKNEVFMVTDGHHGAKLHRCLKFPMSWHLNATLTTEPLRGVSIIKAPVPEGVELAEEKWLMVGSISSCSGSLEDDVIAVYTSSSPLGPWKKHEQSPFHIHAASPGGGLAILPNKGDGSTIIRLGRSCTGGYTSCSDVVASKFDFTDDTLREEPLSLPPHQIFLGERVWRQGGGWDGGERSAATVAALPSGKVAAIVLGKPIPRHIRPWYAFWLESVLFLLQGVVASCFLSLAAMLVLKKGGKCILKSSKGFGGDYISNITTRRVVTISPSGAHGNTNGTKGDGDSSGGGGASSSLAGGYTPKTTSLAIQRLQAEERGELLQPISPRGRAVLTSRAAARHGEGSTSTGAALAADLAARFAAFAMPLSSSPKHSSAILPSLSASSPSPGNYNHRNTSPLANNNPTFRRRSQQLRLALRGAIQRWAIRLLEATPRQIMFFLSITFIISCATFVVGRVHTLFYPFWAPAPPLEVGGQYSRFTLLVMSYESRRSLLEGYIRNYQQCPSVGEILVVWNQQQQEMTSINRTTLLSLPPPPDPLKDFPWATVPIRVRAHSNNSLTNRYYPDDQLRFRGVLSLDDDLRIPCIDIERAFARWRTSPSSLTGFVPRLAEVSVNPRYQTEQESIAKGWYNLILTGAAFIDSRAAFAAYWNKDSKPMQEARNVVDSLFNCDDLLMNFVVANRTESPTNRRGKKQGSVLYVRPSRRLDLSWWSGVGLSHSVNHFLQDAEMCLIEFEKIFGRWPLRAEEYNWLVSETQGGGGKPKCSAKGRSHLDCSYLS
jgi:Glycosyl transferase family 64 domain